MAVLYCWSCRAAVHTDHGRCPACGGEIAPPPGTGYTDALVWALDHPLAERRILAANILGTRGDPRAATPLRRLADASDDPYLAAAALQAAVRIDGPDASRALLRRLARDGPAPVRAVAVAELAALDDASGRAGTTPGAEHHDTTG